MVREIGLGTEADAIVGRLKDHFHDVDDAMAREAAAFIAELRERGLVEE